MIESVLPDPALRVARRLAYEALPYDDLEPGEEMSVEVTSGEHSASIRVVREDKEEGE